MGAFALPYSTSSEPIEWWSRVNFTHLLDAAGFKPSFKRIKGDWVESSPEMFELITDAESCLWLVQTVSDFSFSSYRLTGLQVSNVVTTLVTSSRQMRIQIPIRLRFVSSPDSPMGLPVCALFAPGEGKF